MSDHKTKKHNIASKICGGVVGGFESLLLSLPKAINEIILIAEKPQNAKDIDPYSLLGLILLVPPASILISPIYGAKKGCEFGASHSFKDVPKSLFTHSLFSKKSWKKEEPQLDSTSTLKIN